MSQTVGLVPWLPGPLAWLAKPIPAERLAAWRIFTGMVLLFDVCVFYQPVLGQMYGPNSLADPNVFAERFAWPHWNWSILNWLPENSGPTVAISIWIVSAAALIVGFFPNMAALIALVLSISFYNTNFYLHNSGDRLRHFVLLLLIASTTNAAWALRRRPKGAVGPLEVSGWPMRLMLLQMAIMYFMNGYYKLQGHMWWEGSVMWYVNHDVAWSRWASPALPYWSTQVLTWAALIWEIGFPLWLIWRRTRVAALIFGVVFHTVTFFHLEIAAFPLYALCLYVPLAPWEGLRRTSVPFPADPAPGPIVKRAKRRRSKR